MSTGITIGVRFSNGQIAYLQNDDVATGAVGEEILTANQGGDLSQTSGVSVGQAYAGLVATHAFCRVQSQSANTARMLWANFRGPDGAVIVPIGGGGFAVGQMIALYKPVMMTTGVTAFGAWEIQADSGTGTASLDVCSPVKCDNFTVVAVHERDCCDRNDRSLSGFNRAFKSTWRSILFIHYCFRWSIKSTCSGASTISGRLGWSIHNISC